MPSPGASGNPYNWRGHGGHRIGAGRPKGSIRALSFYGRRDLDRCLTNGEPFSHQQVRGIGMILLCSLDRRAVDRAFHYLTQVSDWDRYLDEGSVASPVLHDLEAAFAPFADRDVSLRDWALARIAATLTVE